MIQPNRWPNSGTATEFQAMNSGGSQGIRWLSPNSHYWGRWVDRLVRLDEGWRFAEREVVGIGSIEPDDAGRDREQPGHPGRLER